MPLEPAFEKFCVKTLYNEFVEVLYAREGKAFLEAVQATFSDCWDSDWFLVGNMGIYYIRVTFPYY